MRHAGRAKLLAAPAFAILAGQVRQTRYLFAEGQATLQAYHTTAMACIDLQQ